MGRPRTPIFPRETIAWKQVPEISTCRRIAVSLIEMAIITGVIVRVLRALFLTQGPTQSILFFGFGLALATIVLLGMATLHLSNFTVRHWWWRAPAFAIVEFLAEMATSALLIWLGREPWGASGRAEMSDLPSIAAGTFLWRFIPIVAFALFLALIVNAVRAVVQRREDSRERRGVSAPEI